MPVPETVLIADDEAHIRLYVRLILEELGVTDIREARSGEDAVARFREWRPQMVILDVNMPGVTGPEALEQIISIDPEAVVVMLTAHATRGLIETAASTGAVQYIRKDTPREDILALMGDVFSNCFSEDP